jgi:LytS/YehU family sensor histidine kinase
MSFRRGVNYELKTENIELEANIPPMIFHTLIENGLTHGYENTENGIFIIQREKIENGIQYIISHNGNCSDDRQKKSSGFGMRYVKTRLEESYPKRWSLTSGKVNQEWKTIIEIRNK